MPSRRLTAIVLAAGEGTRMRSAVPKPLHPLCGRSMVGWVLSALAGAGVAPAVVVVGHGADRVRKLVDETAPLPVTFAVQETRLGTGDAAASGLAAVPEGEDVDVMILPGDTPLLEPATLSALVAEHRATGAAATLLTARMADPTGYGRVVRSPGCAVSRVVEHKDANAAERAVDEVNTSVYCFRRPALASALARLRPDNAQGEYYLTDVVATLAGEGVATLVVPDPVEVAGVNDRAQLADAEAVLRERINRSWMRAGVTMADPSATYVDADAVLEADVRLLPGTILEGSTRIGAGSVVGPGTRLADCRVGREAVVEQTVARRADIGDGARVGPFAVLHPGDAVGPGDTAASLQHRHPEGTL